MANVIGQRQTETAITTSRMYKPREALQLGLLDEVVHSENEAFESANAFLEKFKAIPADARALMKLYARERVINSLKENVGNDITAFYQHLNKPDVQEAVRAHFPDRKNRK